MDFSLFFFFLLLFDASDNWMIIAFSDIYLSWKIKAKQNAKHFFYKHFQQKCVRLGKWFIETIVKRSLGIEVFRSSIVSGKLFGFIFKSSHISSRKSSRSRMSRSWTNDGRLAVQFVQMAKCKSRFKRWVIVVDF